MHSEFHELYAAHADGELAPAQREAVELHLAACPACREEYARFVRARRALVDWRAREARWQPAVHQPTMARLAAAQRHDRALAWVWRGARAGALALALFLLVVWAQWWGERPQPATLPATPPPEAQEAGPVFVLGVPAAAAALDAPMALLTLDPASGAVAATLPTGSQATLLPSPPGILAIASVEGGRHLIVAGASGARPIELMLPPGTQPVAVHDTWLYTSSVDGGAGSRRVQRLALATGAAAAPPGPPLCAPADVVVAPDGKALYWLCDGGSSGEERLLRLDAATGQPTGELRLPGADLADLDRPRAVISPDGSRLFVRLPALHPEGPPQVAIAAIALPELTVAALWPLASETAAALGRTPRATARSFGNDLTLLADGRLAVLGDPRTDPTALYLLDPTIGRVIRLDVGHALGHIAAGASHRWLVATTRGSPTLLLIDVAAQRLVAAHPLPLRAVTALAR